MRAAIHFSIGDYRRRKIELNKKIEGKHFFFKQHTEKEITNNNF